MIMEATPLSSSELYQHSSISRVLGGCCLSPAVSGREVETLDSQRQIRMCLQTIILRGFTFKDLQSWIPRSSAELWSSSAPPPPSPSHTPSCSLTL
ncbi:hypothetical protein AMECASPLE_019260 [Ameca splendens]|uniref:Uncharacterized protein n=1 Tax=Ameca splendens TaxID=208324 RepID=A0ABV0ZPV6_9TELE